VSIAGRSAGSIKVGLCSILLGGMLAGCTGTLDQRFDATERQIIAVATQDALENNKTGEGKNWINPATDRSGTVMPTRTFKRSGFPCREFQQTATIEGRTIIANDTACRGADGTWKSEAYTSLDGAISDAPSYQDQRYYDHRYDPYHHHPHYRFGYGYGYPYPYDPHGRFGYYH
jgi:surface antigen